MNAVFNGLLLAGAADGGVRVWRDYTFPGTQKLATAWQVSLVTFQTYRSLHVSLAY